MTKKVTHVRGSLLWHVWGPARVGRCRGSLCGSHTGLLTWVTLCSVVNAVSIGGVSAKQPASKHPQYVPHVSRTLFYFFRCVILVGYPKDVAPCDRKRLQLNHYLVCLGLLLTSEKVLPMALWTFLCFPTRDSVIPSMCSAFQEHEKRKPQMNSNVVNSFLVGN